MLYACGGSSLRTWFARGGSHCRGRRDDSMITFLLGVILVLIIVILWLLRHRASSTTTPPSGTGSAPSIPDQLTPAALATQLKARLVGTPADGSAQPSSAPSQVVWVDSGHELLVHLDGTTTQIVGSTVLVSLDLECDQTGRTPLVVAFALGANDQGGLIAATDEYPSGNGMLASRWGTTAQAAAWSAMLSLAHDHANERGLEPRGLAISGGNL